MPGKIVDNPRFADDDPATNIYERESCETIDHEECDFGWTKDNLFTEWLMLKQRSLNLRWCNAWLVE